MQTEEKNWVAEALEVSKPDNLRRSPEVEADLSSTRAKRAMCLGVEADLIQLLDKQIEELERELSSSKLAEFEGDLGNYKRIDLSVPLSWRTKSGRPRLMPFSLKSNTTTIRQRKVANVVFLDHGGCLVTIVVSAIALVSLIIWLPLMFTSEAGFKLEPIIVFGLLALLFPVWRLAFSLHAKLVSGLKGIHPVLARYYNDMGREPWRDDVTDLSYEASITGAIPPDVKEKINTAKKTFGEDIFLIAEPTSWEMHEKVFKSDPLVVGVKGESTFLIAVFDLTSLEEAVAQEFTS